MGKPGQIGEIKVIVGMLILFWHYVLVHKAGPDIEKALNPVLVFIRETEKQQIYLNLWSVDILSILAERVPHPDKQVGYL